MISDYRSLDDAVAKDMRRRGSVRLIELALVTTLGVISGIYIWKPVFEKKLETEGQQTVSKAPLEKIPEKKVDQA